VLDGRLDLWVDGICLAGIEAARHQHRREDVVEAGPILDQREIRLEVLEIRALAFAIVFAGSMGVGGVLSPLLFDWAVSLGSHAIAVVYLFAALLMVAVAVAVAPVVWLRRRPRPRLWPDWQVSQDVLPDRSGEELEIRPPIPAG
jgi:MFS family permease